MNKKDYTILTVLIAVLAVGVWFYSSNNRLNLPGAGTACTQEAKLCPDGSAVGRTGPNCEFAECPSESSCGDSACPIATQDNSPAVDETTKDWQIYKNSKYNFQLRFPKEWQASGRPANANIVSFIDEPGSEENPDTIELEVRVIDDKKYDSLKSFLAAMDKVSLTAWEGKQAVNVAKEESKKIDGQEAIRREVYLNAAGFPALETYIFKGGKIYKVSMNLYIGEIVLGRVNLYNKIISTFDFL